MSSTAAVAAHRSFGPLLRKLRGSAGLSQERLAQHAEVSARHLSFLETGRSAPSRDMVLVLASALDLPLRDRNTLLTSAGFAPVYRQSSLEDDALASVKVAFDHILRGFEPHGAVLVDGSWNVLQMNGGAQRLMGWALADRSPPPEALGNVLHGLFHPEGLRALMVNWEEVAGLLVARHERDLALRPDPQARALLNALLAYPGVPESLRGPRPLTGTLPFVPVHLRKNGVDLRLFTVLTSLGTPADVTAEELRVEAYFPADEATTAFVQKLAHS